MLPSENVTSLLKTARVLQISGLSCQKKKAKETPVEFLASNVVCGEDEESPTQPHRHKRPATDAFAETDSTTEDMNASGSYSKFPRFMENVKNSEIDDEDEIEYESFEESKEVSL